VGARGGWAVLNAAAIRDALRGFIGRHKAEFDRLSNRRSQLLEVGSLAVCAEHYRLAGYEVRAANLQNGVFRVKLGSRGYPWNFSWFDCARGHNAFEVHSNLSVYSAYRRDEGVYVVDVGVAAGGAIPRSKPAEGWMAIENHALVTFGEAKYLVIYPMLLAQFIGIVSELAPTFLRGERPSGFEDSSHFDPALMSVGYLHATASRIARAYPERGYLVKIVPALDMKLSLLRQDGGLNSSVLGRDHEQEFDVAF